MSLILVFVTWAQLSLSDAWDCYIESYPGRPDVHVCELIESCRGTECTVRLVWTK
jgi:hypothetical protein